jgi:hypothetical protein
MRGFHKIIVAIAAAKTFLFFLLFPTSALLMHATTA